MNSNNYENKKRGKFESVLITLGVFSAIISLFYERFFPSIFIIAALIFLGRSIKSVKIKDYKNLYSNIGITIIFIIGIFLAV